MKALSMIQPWASLVAYRQKKNETRSFACPKKVIGMRVAIHASLTKSAIQDGTAAKLWALTALELPEEWPLGSIVAVVTITGCTPTEKVRDRVDDFEKAFGDYSSGRFAWHLDDVRKLREPIPMKGMLGFWTVPAEFDHLLLEAGK